MTSTVALTPAKSGPTWNPFRCSGTVLPANVLLAAKLIALFSLFANLGGDIAESVFIPVVGNLYDTPPVRWALQCALLASTFLLLLNRKVTLTSPLLGLFVLLNTACFQPTPYRLFCGLFLVLVGLQRDGRLLWLLHAQVALLYLAAGIAGVLGPSIEGYFELLAGRGASTDFVVSDSYVALDSALPPGFLTGVLTWGTTFVALAVGAGLLLRRLRPVAIWAGILYHAALWFLGLPILASPYAMLPFYLVFADWPRTALTVLYDGDCGFCNKTREWISRFDLERLYDWQPYQSGAGDAFGISVEALERRAHVVSPHGVDSGFQAFRMMALYNPLTYFGLAAAAIAVHHAAPLVQNIVLAALILGFSPLVRPIGELVYDWVSRNRHRLPPRGCKIPD